MAEARFCEAPAETATIIYRDGSSRVLARPKGSRRFFFLDDQGEPTESYRTRRTLDEWPQRDQRCERVEFNRTEKSCARVIA